MSWGGSDAVAAAASIRKAGVLGAELDRGVAFDGSDDSDAGGRWAKKKKDAKKKTKGRDWNDIEESDEDNLMASGDNLAPRELAPVPALPC